MGVPQTHGRAALLRTNLLWPCMSPSSFCSLAFFSSSSSSLLFTVRSSCWASHLMSLATTTAVCRSAWNRLHSSVSSCKCQSPHPHQTPAGPAPGRVPHVHHQEGQAGQDLGRHGFNSTHTRKSPGGNYTFVVSELSILKLNG